MTIRNRECKVQAHTLARVCTYSSTISLCTCTKPAARWEHTSKLVEEAHRGADEDIVEISRAEAE